MKRHSRRPNSVASVALIAAVVLGSTALAQSTFIETFESGSNEGGWSYMGAGVIEPSGGNPGAYLDAGVGGFWIEAYTAWAVPSLFTGDYRALGVTSVGVDLITFEASHYGGPLLVMLNSDNGTPSDILDDWAVYKAGPDHVPQPYHGWHSFDFDIPSQSPSLPPDWVYFPYRINSPPSPDWNRVISNVIRLTFYYGYPTGSTEQTWDVGLDNPRITSQAGAGAPGFIPSTMTVGRVPPSEIRIAWEPSVCPGATDYAVYEGVLGDWDSHTSITCSDSLGDLNETLSVSPGNRYYLVVPLNDPDEGSYGLDSSMSERLPASSGACRPTQSLGCF